MLFLTEIMDSNLQKLSLLPKSWDDKFSKQRSHVIKVLPCRLGCYTIFPGHIEQIHATRLLVTNKYLMHLTYAPSLSQHVSHTNCEVHFTFCERENVLYAGFKRYLLVNNTPPQPAWYMCKVKFIQLCIGFIPCQICL